MPYSISSHSNGSRRALATTNNSSVVRSSLNRAKSNQELGAGMQRVINNRVVCGATLSPAAPKTSGSRPSPRRQYTDKVITTEIYADRIRARKERRKKRLANKAVGSPARIQPRAMYSFPMPPSKPKSTPPETAPLSSYNTRCPRAKKQAYAKLFSEKLDPEVARHLKKLHTAIEPEEPPYTLPPLPSSKPEAHEVLLRSTQAPASPSLPRLRRQTEAKQTKGSSSNWTVAYSPERSHASSLK